jgi:hypothetical protein
MLPRRLESIDQALIEQLCGTNCPESQTLEFKRELPPASPDGRAELAKDVCALANAGGGDLIYGIAEVKGCASKPMPISSEAADSAKRRIQQLLEARIEPRVIGLSAYEVRFGEAGYVLVLRVPASFLGPHRYKDDDGNWCFVIRAGTRTADLSYPELRAAFDRTATLTERARQFRAERLAAIASGRTSRPLFAGPQCVVHLIPLMAMDGKTHVDVEPLYHAHPAYARFWFEEWGGSFDRALNLDGLLVYCALPDSGTVGHVQVFRSGAFESLRFAGSMGHANEKMLWALTLCWHVRESLEKLIAAARDYGLTGPAAASVALLGMSGYQFGLWRVGMRQFRPPADRADLVIPELWIERLEEVTNVDPLARQLLDLTYQCFNVSRCEAYDQEGNWLPEGRY